MSRSHRAGPSARLAALAALSLAAILSGLCGNAGAATIEVTRTADDFNSGTGCSLREAIQAANINGNFGGCFPLDAEPYGADTVLVPAGIYRLTRPGIENANSGGDLDLSSTVSIVHPRRLGAAVIDGGGIDRVLDVSGANDIMLSGLEIRGGDSALSGGGVRYQGAGTLTVLSSTISSNRTDANGGGMFSSGVAMLANVTVSGNRSDQDAGGIRSSGAMTLDNVTVARNNADADADETGDGGGFTVSGGPFSTFNTIVGDNTDSSPTPAHRVPDCDSGPSFFPRYTLIESFLPASCLVGFNPGTNITGRDPRLGPLADNGGRGRTHPLRAGSPALDAGGTTIPDLCETNDQRGVPRSAAGRCDLGAYERILCGGVVVNRVGGPGPDVLIGTSGADGMLGFGRVDRLIGRAGPDALCGGAGFDRLRGGPGRDLLLGQAGRDRLRGGTGRDRLRGGPGRDLLHGGPGRDRLRGGPGRDRCIGGGGRDLLLC